MTKTDTWMPLYIGDYLADTMDLTAQEHGAYLLLLMHQWRSGPLADDDRSLAMIARVEPAVWRKTVGPKLRRYFETTPEGLSQKRLARERASAADISGKRREAGKRGASSRWQGKPNDGNPGGGGGGDSMANAMANGMAGPSAEPWQNDRPLPSQPPSEVINPPAPPARATKLDADWWPSGEDQDFARTMGIDPSPLAEKFRDHYRSTAGPEAYQRDWSARFRLWCREDAARMADPARRNGAHRAPAGKLDWMYEDAEADRLRRIEGRGVE